MGRGAAVPAAHDAEKVSARQRHHLVTHHAAQGWGFCHKVLSGLRVIPQGTTVDNNLGQDRLIAGAKALDRNYCRQSTL